MLPSPLAGEGRISTRGTSVRNSGEGWWLSHDTILDIGQPINVIPHLLRDLKDKIRSRNKSGMTLVSCHCEVPKARHHVRQYSCDLSCHCEAERSEAVAIAKSLDTPRNDKYVSEAHRKELNVLTSYRLNDFKKKIAFTLAEVLITLAIIGVVAAMTIPTLITKYQEKQTVSQLTKVYSTLASAYQMMQAEYGTIDTWGMNTPTNTGEVDEEGKPIYNHSAQNLISERMRKYLRVAKQCEVGKVCFPGAYYTLDGVKRREANTVATNTGDSPVEGTFFLQDGTYVTFAWWVISYGGIAVSLPQGKDSVLGKNRFFSILIKTACVLMV